MRRALIIVVATGLFAAAAAAEAQTIAFTSTLTGGQEAPNAVSTGAFGEADITWNTATQTLTWIIDVFNMPSGTTAAHFHVSPPGAAGPTVVNIPVPAQISNDFRLTGSASCADVVERAALGIRSCQDFEQSLLGGQLYLNVHSNNNPAGEIRGQVLRVLQF